MLRRSLLALLAGAALVLTIVFGGALIGRNAPQGTIELLAARHGGVADAITEVTLHGPDGDVTIRPASRPLLAAPAESDLGTALVAARTYSDVEVRRGSLRLHHTTAITVTATGITPILLGFDNGSLSVYAGNDRTSLGLEILGRRLTTLPATTFTDQNGAPVSLASLQGKVTVVAAFLTHCHESCPLSTAIFSDLTKVLRFRGLSDKVNLVEVTMDPGRDTPPVLRAYAQKTGATWPLLTAPEASLRQFWGALHASYSTVPYTSPPPVDWYTGQSEAYDVSHDSLAVVLDQRGYPRFDLAGNPHLGHALSKPLARFLSPDLVSLAANQQGWTLQDLLNRTDALLGQPSEPPVGSDAGARDGSPAPLFTLSDLAGKPTALHDHLGQAVIVNFWATWCDPCRRELPLLNSVAQRGNAVVLALDQGENAGTVKPFLGQVLGPHAGITALLDADSHVGNAYAVAGLPVSVFIDPAGIVRGVHIGELDAPALASELRGIGAA